MIVRVYKDINVDDSEEENYKEVAIDVAIGFLGDWDVEIIQEPRKPKTREEHFDQCLRKWGGNGQR